MESSSRLSSGPLSQAAQKVMAVLQAQTLCAARHNYNYNYRQIVERYDDSQRSQEERKERNKDRPWSRPQVSSLSTSYHDVSNQWQSSQTSACYQYSQTPDCSLSSQASSCSSSCCDSSGQMSQPEAHYLYSQIYSHRKYSEPPASQTSQALSFTQHEETAASFSHRDTCTLLSLQIPERQCGQTTAWRKQVMEKMGSTEEKIRPLFTCNLSLDEEVQDQLWLSTSGHKAAPALAGHRVFSCHKITEEKESTYTESYTMASDSEVKWRLPLSNPTGEVISRAEDEGKPYQQSEEGTDRRRWTRHQPNEKGSANEMEGPLLLGACEGNLNLTSISKVHYYCEDANTGQKEDTVYRVNAPENREAEHPPGIEDKEVSVEPLGENKVSHSRTENPQDGSQIVTESSTDTTLIRCRTQDTKLVLGGTTADNLQRSAERSIDVLDVGLDVQRESSDAKPEDKTEQPHCSDEQIRESLYESDSREVHELPRGDSEPATYECVRPPVDSANGGTSTEDSGRESYSTPTLSQECRPERSEFRASCLLGNHQHHDNEQTANGNLRESLNEVPALASTFAAGQNSSSVQVLALTSTKPSKNLENSHLLTSHTHPCYPPLIPSFPLKRKHEGPQHQCADPPPKVYLTRRPLKWEPPQVKSGEVGASELNRAKLNTSVPEPPPEPPEPHKTGTVSGIQDQYAPKKTRQICRESARKASKQAPSSVTCKPLKHKRAKCGPDSGINGPMTSHEEATCNDVQNQSKAGCLTAALTSDPRVKNSGKMNPEEKMQILEKAGKTKALVLTLVYRDGTTQLDPEQKLTPAVCGLFVLMKNDLNHGSPDDLLGPNDILVYLKLEHTPAWAQQHTHQSQEHFTRDMLLQVISRCQLVVCYKAKDLLRTALQFYSGDLSWKQVAGCHIQDPQVSGWLLDPANPSTCYQDLLSTHCKIAHTTPALGAKKVSQIISGLSSLYWLNIELCFKLQSQGLWELYSHLELNMICVLAAMESHHIHVDKEALKRTSDLLGAKMKQLEQEAHRAAGQIFLITSNTQLRTVLFEKLGLHKRCENKKLPKTINKQQQSTSEAVLLQLQDLHPLPKVILEYRQVHKIKSTFVDGILSCMMSKNYVSSTWHQTSAVTGRITAKHPNFQALPRQPLQFTRKPYIQGKEEDVVTVHPRAMFIPQEGWTFLAADFCQVELRLLAHLSSDPELLRIFINPQADVFTMLASQWKGVSEGEVTSEDREHAKRIVYSVVYGAGRERLSGILGVSAEQASRFQDSFLQTYREVQAFIQRTIQQCHKHGYVLSIMGRRRTLPNINSPDWGIRMQAERQAVNFVVQGSAADLCKMAMIRIFNLVSSSSSLSARLVAQLHDELLYEVEDSQVQQFAGLVRSTMESLQHIDNLGVHLKVPLKVAVSSGKSWGSMSEFNIPPASPSPSL